MLYSPPREVNLAWISSGLGICVSSSLNAILLAEVSLKEITFGSRLVQNLSELGTEVAWFMLTVPMPMLVYYFYLSRAWNRNMQVQLDDEMRQLVDELASEAPIQSIDDRVRLEQQALERIITSRGNIEFQEFTCALMGLGLISAGIGSGFMLYAKYASNRGINRTARLI